MVDLKQTLSRFLSIPGVWQAILVGRDGLMIEGLTRDGKDDMEAVGAIMTTGLSTAEALGQEISRDQFLHKLIDLQYERNDIAFNRSHFRVRGDTVEVWTSSTEDALRVAGAPGRDHRNG